MLLTSLQNKKKEFKDENFNINNLLELASQFEIEDEDL